MALKDYPIFITTRDFLSYLVLLIDWLEKAGYEEIYIVDNDSEWEPMVDYLESTPHTVVQTGSNLGNMAAWLSGAIDKYAADRYFVVTDHDCVPIKECPLDILHYYKDVLDEHDPLMRIMASLKIDDLPDHYVHKYEAEMNNWLLLRDDLRIPDNNNFFNVTGDTTFGMYKPGTTLDPSESNGFWLPHSEIASHPLINIYPGAYDYNGEPGATWKSDHPYMINHMPFYEDTSNPSEELQFFHSRAESKYTTWTESELKDRSKNRTDTLKKFYNMESTRKIYHDKYK